MTTITTPPVVLSEAFCLRCIRFYRDQQELQDRNTSDIWKGVISFFLSPLHNALMEGNTQAIQTFFTNYYSGSTAFGVDLGNDLTEDAFLRIWWQKLRNLCESVGLTSLYNPEQPEDPSLFKPEESIPQLEEHFGFRIEHPGFGCRAVSIDNRVIPAKLLESLLVFRTIRPNGWTLEIGGGVGMNCYVAEKIWRQSRYLMADLPIMSVVQGVFLQGALGESEVSFDGEPQSRVRLEGLNPSDFRLELVINVDSLPEIPEKCQKSYLRRIEELLLPGRLFYSRNHESPNGGQRSVPTMMKSSSLVRVSRSKDWMREGYVEEVWKKLSA